MTDSLFARLRDEIGKIPIIDSHEHLPNESDRLAQPVDFFTLFSHYVSGDLGGAGAPANLASQLSSPDFTPAQKWELFAPYYDRLADGSYARAAHIAIKKFYDMDRLTSVADAETLTERIRAANTPGLYRRVLRDACNIVTSLNFVGMGAVDREFFIPVLFITHLAEINQIGQLRAMEEAVGRPLTSLSRYVDGAGEWLRQQRDEHGLKGVKFHFAYMRPLLFESVTTSDAERIFNRITDEAQGWRNTTLGYDETRPLQDYLVHRLIEIAGDLDLTVVFHTGIQGNGDNNLDNCRPERLWNLISRYRHVRFNLLHAGIPWMEEAGMMAKYFGNVTLDMGWAHAISPELSVRALKTWIDMVPRHKILGFGGDYMVVEKVYGHLEMARDNIARALADKVADGSFSEDRAIAWAQALLHGNVILAYDLKI